MQYNRPIVLSIAGFDPCAGAGVLADIKTFEQLRCLGMAVNTCITVQTENHFSSLNWLALEEIEKSIRILMTNYEIHFIKIGLIENLSVLAKVVNLLKTLNPEVKIIWDPVLSASSGFSFMDEVEQDQLTIILKTIYLLTPNVNEVRTLTQCDDEILASEMLSKQVNVLLKGGHSKNNKGVDFLFYENNCITIDKITNDIVYEKHGSGCILSSAITANLALGLDLISACNEAKAYIEKILKSNPKLLAYHVA
jgi:hydroxymethylpyrimidine/phosphomethylpyrimidine kinase